MGAGCLSFSGRKGTPQPRGGQPGDPRKFEPSIMRTAFAADARQLAAEIPNKKAGEIDGEIYSVTDD